jgi:hypothetical protein
VYAEEAARQRHTGVKTGPVNGDAPGPNIVLADEINSAPQTPPSESPEKKAQEVLVLRGGFNGFQANYHVNLRDL